MWCWLSLKILSLDLDWFNHCDEDAEWYIQNFFDRLFRECRVPQEIVFFRSHQYLYPWVNYILKKQNISCADIVNIDEHHDFLRADQSRFTEDDIVDCGNFFLYMVMDGIICNHDWVGNRVTYWVDENELVFMLRQIHSIQLQKDVFDPFIERVKVWSREQVFEPLAGEDFHAFAVIDSPEYTNKFSRVKKTVLKIFRTNGFGIQQHRCKKHFPYSQVNHIKSVQHLLTPLN